MAEKVKTFWEKHNGWLIQIILLLVSVGAIYGAMSESIKNKPNRDEMQSAIEERMQKHIQESKEVYIKIDQVPGLKENIENINGKIDDIKKSQDLILQKIMKSNK